MAATVVAIDTGCKGSSNVSNTSTIIGSINNAAAGNGSRSTSTQTGTDTGSTCSSYISSTVVVMGRLHLKSWIRRQHVCIWMWKKQS